MGKINDKILPAQINFIEQQHMFFVATSGDDTRINLSPKGLDALHIVDENRVVWLNLTGSGNETAAHLLENTHMTLMFCSFGDKPLIVRLYGHAKAINPEDKAFEKLSELFPNYTGTRQLFDMHVDATQSSCGSGVPLYDYLGQRETLIDWTAKKGENGLREYKQQKNRVSIDGKPTGLFDS